MLRRAGLNICTISMNDDLSVKTAHGVILQADELFDHADYTKSELLILPGGSMKLNEYPALKEVLKVHNAKGRHIAAICAAPAVLGCAGLL
ncbi:MAG: DJ-1/PfpI family protein, partial [Prevotellaceae bacterium]|nr:DJ-1/PfpI family protein [Prevotellaceae bacterium]